MLLEVLEVALEVPEVLLELLGLLRVKRAILGLPKNPENLSCHTFLGSLLILIFTGNCL